MAESTTGRKGLNLTAKLSVAEAIASAQLLKKELASIGIAASKGSGASFDIRPLTAYQQKQLELKKALIDAQAVSEDLRQKNIALDASYKAGKISAQEAATATKEYMLQRRQLVDAEKDARKAQVAANGSYDEANAKLLALGRSIKSAEGGFNSTNPAIRAQVTEYNKLNQSLKEFDATMGNNQRKVGGYRDALNSAGADLKSMALNYVSAYAALSAVTYVIKTNAEISDSLSDVRRTAGLTEDEVNNLAESLKKIDTRTSLKDLLDIAVIGGQLGVAKDQLGGFTKAIDQLSVTLAGEISGGAEAVASSLGKINGVFKTQQKEGTDVETSFNKTGSAILALGQAGLATGEFLQDFGLRTAGVANIAKISLPVILAYGATLEETGSSAEVAGSSIAKLIGNLASRKEQFFAIAKIADSTLTIKSFTDLINTDANAALQKFFAGLNAGGKDLTSFTDLIDQIGLKGGPAKNAIIGLAQNQGLLNERIGESQKAYDAGTLSAEQFALKNDNLAGSISKLSNTFDNALQGDGIGKFFKSMVDGARNALSEIDKLFKSRSFSELTKRLFTFDASAYDKVNTVTDNYTSSNAARLKYNKDNNPLGSDNSIVVSALADKPLKDLKNMISQYKTAVGDAAKALNTYEVGVQKGTLTEDGAIKIADAKKNYTQLRGILDQVTQAYVIARDSAKSSATVQVSTSKEVADSQLKTVKEINARILELKNDALAIPANKESDVKRIQKLKEELRDIAGSAGTTTDPSVPILASQKSTLAQLDALKDKYASKDKTRDEQEQDAIIADFKKRSDLIDAQNAKLANYLKFHTNAQAKAAGLSYIDPSSLDSAKSDAFAGLAGRQAVTALQQQIEQQKAIYKEYEDYKLKAGTQAADELYGSQIGNFKSYVAYLKSLEPTVEQLTSPDPKVKSKATKTQDLLNKEEADANTASIIENKKYLEQYLIDTQSFSDRQEATISKANDEIAVLTKASFDKQLELGMRGRNTEAAAVKADYDRRIQLAKDSAEALLDQQVLQQNQQLECYRGLADSIVSSTLGQARFTIEQAKINLKLEEGKMSAEAYAKALGYIAQAEAALKTDVILHGLDAIASAFGQLSNASEGLDKKLSGAFKGISDLFGDTGTLIGGITKLSSELKNFSDQKKQATDDSKSSFLGTVSTISNMIPIAGAVISAGIKIVTGVVNFFKAAKATAVASAAELVAYQQRIITGQITYNEYLREQARSQQDINDLTGVELQNRLKILATQKQQAQTDFNTLLAQGAATGQYVTGEHTEKYGGILGIGKKTKVVQDTATIAGMTYDQINALDIQGKLTGPTKEWFDQLKASNTEISDINAALADAQKQTDQIFTGTTAKSITDIIVQGFKDGKRTLADFADDFKTLMQGALLSTFESNFLSAKIADFYKEFATVSEDADGLTAADEAALKNKYAQIIADSNAQIANIEKVTGPLSSSTSSTSTKSLSGAISGITATQADLLAGQFGGLRLAQLETNNLLKPIGLSLGDMYQIVKSNFDVQVKIEANTKVSADNSEFLKKIPEMLSTLASIDKKTGADAASLKAAGR